MNPDSSPSGSIALTGQAVLSVQGPDRLRFLNGQVTNDLRSIQGDACLPTAVLDVKGRLEAICHVREMDDALLLDAHAALRETLPARLDRYLIADDVELVDVSDSWHLVHILGAPAPNLPGTHQFPVNRFGIPGIDLLCPAPLDPDLPALDPSEVESLRIRHGVPLWPAELHAGVFPAEAGLDATAVSFDKGCYLGQEVVSRMKRAGKTNQHLVLLSVPADTTPGTCLHHGDREAGTITSVSPVPESDGQHLALAYRRRQHDNVPEFDLASGTAKVLRQLT